MINNNRRAGIPPPTCNLFICKELAYAQSSDKLFIYSPTSLSSHNKFIPSLSLCIVRQRDNKRVNVFL